MDVSHQALGPNQTKWIEALESGKYQQGEAMLRFNDCYCCLGVGSEVVLGPPIGKDKLIAGYRYQWGAFNEAHMAPQEFMEEVALNTNSGEINSSRLSPSQKKKRDEYVAGVFLSEEDVPFILDLICLNDNGWTFPQIATHLRKYAHLYFKESR